MESWRFPRLDEYQNKLLTKINLKRHDKQSISGHLEVGTCTLKVTPVGYRRPRTVRMWHFVLTDGGSFVHPSCQAVRRSAIRCMAWDAWRRTGGCPSQRIPNKPAKRGVSPTRTESY